MPKMFPTRLARCTETEVSAMGGVNYLIHSDEKVKLYRSQLLLDRFKKIYA